MVNGNDDVNQASDKDKQSGEEGGISDTSTEPSSMEEITRKEPDGETIDRGRPILGDILKRIRDLGQ